jgi:hypothetical protein
MNTATIDNMMRRLGIDVGCRVVPRVRPALRLRAGQLRFPCGACGMLGLAREEGRRRIRTAEILREPDLLSELLCDPAIGRRLHR